MTLTRRSLMTAVAAGTAAASPGASPALAATPLSWRVLQGAPTSFGKTSVLLTGQRDAVLVDGMFTLAEGRMAVEAIRASGKRLTTVFVSHGDPDYYFSLEVVRAAFPEARFLATPSTVAHINATMAKKLETWVPRMGDNAPRSPFVPEAMTGTTLRLEDEVLELVTPEGALPDRGYLWSPSLGAMFGGVLAFAGLHAWTADTATPASRLAWRRALVAMEARNPRIVVAGHGVAGAATDASSLRSTREYLEVFEAEFAAAADGAALIAAMKRRYPGLGLEIALEIGAKVAKGEMNW